ncbi:MAG: ParB/RepB/Spo0J family partition protein [Negativicutes bacterium]|nr:ParB/RepB/Spo0J family partition protein [Negativicutes bacterium]
MSVSRGLGRGLGSLIPGIADDRIVEVPIDSLTANPYQPRGCFDDQGLEELAASLRQQGLMQPLIVRQTDDGWQIVAGERRWRAAKKAGWATVRAVVQQCDDRAMMEWALVENLQRENLNPLDEAQAYRNLIDHFGMTQEEVATRVGKSRSAVANCLRLLNLPFNVQEQVRLGRLSSGQARALLALPAREIEAAAEKIITLQLTVRETEELARQDKGKKQVSGNKPQLAPAGDPYAQAAIERMTELLATRVRIRQGKSRGKIEIEYYGREDLQRIIDCLTGGGERQWGGSETTNFSV